MPRGNSVARHRAGWFAGVAAAAGLLVIMVFALAGTSARAQTRAQAAAAPPAVTAPSVTGNQCPAMVFEPTADFYLVQPSFHAGYFNVWEKFNSTTDRWGFVLSGQFPYSQWMSWNLYNITGVPTYTFLRQNIEADPGSQNPFEAGVPILTPKRSYHLYLMPDTTPDSVIAAMKAKFGAGNVAKLPNDHTPMLTLPNGESTASWAIIQRSYWSFSFNGGAFKDYDRFGYGGPTNTPFPTVHAFLTDPKTGELTNTPAGDCGAQSIIPRPTWFNDVTRKPIINAAILPRPIVRVVNPPQFLLNNGFIVGSAPPFAPPTPNPQYVQFFRNSASQAPYADVSQLPAPAGPGATHPDACGGYVGANLPNNQVSLIHVPELPSFPNYSGATSSTLRNYAQDVDFWSMIMYGVNRQVFGFGSPSPLRVLRNSELANQEIATNGDGSATFVIYPVSANLGQVLRIQAIAKANGWNLLHGGVKTRAIPLNLMLIREKGQRSSWANAISANMVTQGAPCYYSNPAVPPDFPFNQVPASFQVTQDNGMGLTAPNGQNCTIRQFVTGACLQALVAQYEQFGWKWNMADTFPSGQLGSGGEGGGGSGGA